METRQRNPFTYKDLLKGERVYSLATAFVLLGISFIFEHFASVYAFAYSLRPTSTYVGDLLLDNIPVVNLNFIIVEGALLSIVAGTLFVFSKPRAILFSLKTLALFIATRAFFTSLTHVGIYPDHISPGVGFFDSLYAYFNFQTGFFFSGHTALPFLMALVFWDNRPVRFALLALSFVFAVAMLFAHLHYSIDIFAAPFMAYGIFKVAQKFFRRDYELLKSSV